MFDDLFDQLAQNPMNAWVGGGDPREVTAANIALLRKFYPLDRAARVHDFGCGIGRMVVALKHQYGDALSIVGTDIVPAMISFCKQTLQPRMNGTDFLCLDAGSVMYDQWKTSDDPRPASEARFFTENARSFDLIYSFSVFTHLYKSEMERYLSLFSQSLQLNGTLAVSCFLLDGPTRRAINEKKTHNDALVEIGEDRDLYFGNPANELGFVAIGTDSFVSLLDGAGFQVEAAIYGSWRTKQPRAHQIHQDTIIARLRPQLPVDFDGARYLELHPDVKQSGVDPSKHYMAHGSRERRRYT